MTAAVLLAAAAGCGGGGGQSRPAGSIHAPTHGIVALLDHSPADGSLQVPMDAVIELVFDSSIALDSLGDSDTWLKAAGADNAIPGSYSAASGGQRIQFRPSSPLLPETDYQFQLSGLTCDLTGRLVDRNLGFSFRTIDNTPPQLLAVDVADGSRDQPRSTSYTFTFDEGIAQHSLTPASLYLRDIYGGIYPGSRQAQGNTAIFTPYAELPGERDFILVLTAEVTDRAGNPLQQGTEIRFRTWDDHDRPSVLSMWPVPNSTGISPLVQPTYTFTESMDSTSVEISSLRFEDEFGSLVPFAVHASPDQRTLRLEPLSPLQPQRRYSLSFLLGEAAVTDVSGNPLHATQALEFTTGSDAEPPVLLHSDPAEGAQRVSGNAELLLVFDEALDPSWIDHRLVRLQAGDEEVVAVVEQSLPNCLRIVPVQLLPVDQACRLVLQGGHDGLRDLAGNVLPADLVLEFQTSADSRLPHVQFRPAHGANFIPRGSSIALLFATPMDHATLQPSAIALCDDAGNELPTTMSSRAEGRIVQLTPLQPLAALTHYRTRIRGGSNGVRTASGNWFSSDQEARFRTSSSFDVTAPVLQARINGIEDTRAQNLWLPPYGFTLEVELQDPVDHAGNLGSLDLRFTGPGAAPETDLLLRSASFGTHSLVVQLPTEQALAAGEWTLEVHAQDLSGNPATPVLRSFRVVEPTTAMLPFERTQVVWVRTDMDRSRSGTLDFDEDMLRLGFHAAGDPAQTNGWMRELILDGILAKANRLYGRGDRGEPLNSGSVALRFTKRRPIALVHTQIALGGLDPEGRRNRGYGEPSTGILGRAYYDHRNGNMGDRNIATSPGLGVFPAEMWLYQARIHEQVWPAFQTQFAQRFRPLCPDMGGVPAGANPLDAHILRHDFDFESAPANQRARFLTIMQAANDWTSVVGIILAHEVGHAVGLVAPGPSPRGLHGDHSLHNNFAGAAEVMAPSIGYEAMTTLDYGFRDLDLAYLRQQVLLR